MVLADVIYWDPNNNIILLSNLAIAIALLTSAKWLSGIVSHTSASDELSKKENPAYGISLAGVLFAIATILSGVIYGDPVYDFRNSVMATTSYGVLAIILMALTRIIFDKLCLPKISIRQEIVKGNISAAIIDAGNMVATAVIIRAIMIWVDTSYTPHLDQGYTFLKVLLSIISAYLISQVILTALTYIQVNFFRLKVKGRYIQEEFKQNNIALSVRYAGRRIGVAFAITAASNLIIFDLEEISFLLFAWAIVSLLMIGFAGFLSLLANRIILFKIKTEEEVVKEQNIAVGILQAIIFITISMLLAELLT